MARMGGKLTGSIRHSVFGIQPKPPALVWLTAECCMSKLGLASHDARHVETSP